MRRCTILIVATLMFATVANANSPCDNKTDAVYSKGLLYSSPSVDLIREWLDWISYGGDPEYYEHDCGDDKYIICSFAMGCGIVYTSIIIYKYDGSSWRLTDARKSYNWFEEFPKIVINDNDCSVIVECKDSRDIINLNELGILEVPRPIPDIVYSSDDLLNIFASYGFPETFTTPDKEKYAVIIKVEGGKCSVQDQYFIYRYIDSYWVLCKVLITYSGSEIVEDESVKPIYIMDTEVSHKIEIRDLNPLSEEAVQQYIDSHLE